MDRQNASSSSLQASTALRGARTDAESRHTCRAESASPALVHLCRRGDVTDDDLRARVEAIVHEARAQRAADLGEIIGVGLTAISTELGQMIRFAGRNVRALSPPRIRRLLSKK